MDIIHFTRDQWAEHWDQLESFLIDDLKVKYAIESMKFDTPIFAVNESGEVVGFANLQESGDLQVLTRDPNVAAELANELRQIHPDVRVKNIYTLNGKFRSRRPCLTKEFAGRWSEFI